MLISLPLMEYFFDSDHLWHQQINLDIDQINADAT